MSRRRLIPFSVFVLLAAASAADAVDKGKLRQAIQLPGPSVVVSYGVTRDGRFTGNADIETAQPEKIAEIEKQLKGDDTDAERYSRLADLYSRARQWAKCKEARRKAATLFRRQLAQRPEDTTCVMRLAEALQFAGELKEAETLARGVVKKHPSDWHAWLLLGEILDTRCLAILGNEASPPPGTANAGPDIPIIRATAREMERGRHLHQEAMTCFDRAVTLAPREAETHRWRGASRYHYGRYECGMRIAGGEKAEAVVAVFSRDAASDLRQVVALGKEEYLGLGMVIMLQATADSLDRSVAKPSPGQAKKLKVPLSAATQKRLRADVAILEQGLRSPNRRKAAEAGEVLGLVQGWLLADQAAAEKTLRQSLQLDPSRTIAWEVLCCILKDRAEYRQLAELGRQRLEQKDSVRDRVFLAIALSHLNQPDGAEEVIRVGIQRDPDNVLLTLTLADLLLMHDDRSSVKLAGDMLARLQRETHLEREEQYCASFGSACGIYLGLTGEPEKARQVLKAVQKLEPDNKNLQDALKALDD